MPAAGAIEIPLSLLVVFASAKLLAELFERLGQPGIVGEILAGILIGPHVLGWMAPNDFLRALSDLGLMFLFFRVGLEVKSADLMRVGGTALAVAFTGVTCAFALGWGAARLWGAAPIESVFVGAAIAATSLAVSARVLASQGLLDSRAAQVILASAVVDDVLGLVVLALVSGMARGSVRYLDAALTAALALGFTIVVAKFGTATLRRVVPRVQARLSLAEGEFALSMTLLFALSVLAVYAGVAAIIGAFLAGMALSETVERRVSDFTNGVSELLVPFFLAGIGLQFDPAPFRSPSMLGLAALILAACIVSKVAACALAAARLGRADAIRVGVGMIPRGEVAMVVAQLGLRIGAIAAGVYGVIVFISVGTAMIAPPLLKRAFRGVPAAPRPEEEELTRVG
jgi:Kef-type K+ transport system membrane component KefB